MKEEINNNTIIVGDFNIPLTSMDRSTKQKINKETQTLNDTTDQLDLIDIYRTSHPKTMNFTFFSNAHETFSRIGHILGHKSSLDKFKKIEIIPSIFSDHNAVRLDLNYRRNRFWLLCFHFHSFLCIFWFLFWFLLWFVGYSAACCSSSICWNF